MGTKMTVGSATSLYEFWGDLITDNLLADLNTQPLDGKEYDQMMKLGESSLKDDGAAASLQKTTKKGEKTKVALENIDASKEGSNSAPTSLNQGRIKVIVNLASQEYFKSVRTKRLCADPLVRVVECVFKDKGRVTSVYAKRARGLMARYIVTQAIPSPSQSIPSGQALRNIHRPTDATYFIECGIKLLFTALVRLLESAHAIRMSHLMSSQKSMEQVK